MLRRFTGTPAFAVGLLLAAGCLHPVTEKVDATVCTIAARPRDVDPESVATNTVKSTPVQISPTITDEITAAGLSQTPGQPAAGGQTPSTAQSALQNRLTLPPGLPGANAPAINLPPLTPENEAKRREAINKLYSPLEPLGPDPKPNPGPDGRPLTLADLQRLGLTNSPLLRQAAANVEAARGAAVQAGAYPNPQVGFEQDTINTAGSPAYVGGFFDQKIIMGSKLQLARAAATMDLKNAELALKRAETDLVSKIRGGYFAVIVAQENERISRDLAKFTTDIYQIQVEQVSKGGIAAPYEPLQLRALAIQARASLVTARNRYTSAWKQLVAAMGLPGLPPTELAGRVDAPLPVFDHDFVLNYALHNHTDVRTAENTFIKSQFNLRLARQTVIPDVDVRVMVQKDYTGIPFNMDPSVQIYFPLPVWDRNQGGIIQAQGNAVNASEESHRVRSDLTTRLADAFERYNTNRVLLSYYRDQILPDLVRAYRGIYLRYQTELAPGGFGPVAPPAAATTPPQFADVVVGQQNLITAVVTYVQTLGLAWQAVVDVADLLQTDDIYRVGDQVFPTECPAPLPDIGVLPPLPCNHPCSPLPDPALKGAHGEWPPADRRLEPKPASTMVEQKKITRKKTEPAPMPTAKPPEALPAFLVGNPVTNKPNREASLPEVAPVERVDSKLLEPPPDVPKREGSQQP
jgi:cobalt-zinc-cadmium efflux system outer membrane protein